MTDPAGRTASVRLSPRWDDCDALGHVNNAMYLVLVRSATDEAFVALGLPDWLKEARLAEAELTYREPVSVGDEILVRIHVRAAHECDLVLAYELAVRERTCAVVSAHWQHVDVPPHATLTDHSSDAGGAPFIMRHRVRSYEVGADGAARPAVVLQWLEHAVFLAAEAVGWTRDRMRDADFVTLQVGHHLALGAPARAGDELRIESRLVEVRRVSGVWRHEVRGAGGELVALDDSRGAFLDHRGRIRAAPEGMLGALLGGPVAGGGVAR